MKQNTKKYLKVFSMVIIVGLILHSFILPWYELRERDVEIGKDLKMSDLSEVWNTIKSELDLEDEEVYLSKFDNPYSVDMERIDDVYIRSFSIQFDYKSGEKIVYRRVRYRDGELRIHRATVFEPKAYQQRTMLMDQFMETMGDVDYTQLMEIGDTESDKHHMFMERFLEPGEDIQASQRLIKMKHVLCDDNLYRALEHEEEVVLGKEYIMFTLLPIMDVMHEVVEVSNGKEEVIKTLGTSSFGQNLLVYIPVNDVEYVKVIESMTPFDTSSYIKSLEEDGVRGIEILEDGYNSYMMPKEKYEELMIKLNQEFSNITESIVEENRYGYVLGISKNSNYTVFDVLVDGDEYHKTVGNNDLLLLGSFGECYAHLNGERSVEVKVNFLDVNGGEIIETKTFYF